MNDPPYPTDYRSDKALLEIASYQLEKEAAAFHQIPQEMRAGKSRLAAILEAGHKRARPIVMTTVAMVAGMLPVAVGWGGDSDFRGPMAIAVIGGLITSTALTLVIVPAVFTVLDDIERWIAPKAGRLLAKRAAGSEQGTPGSKRPRVEPAA